MDDLPPGPAPEAAPDHVGDQLRVAREAAGLSLSEVASRTRVPLRHLQAIENNDYSALPSPTYATGFAKAYARAVNADEVTVGRRVRGELAGMTRRMPAYEPFEVTDPSRVPSRGLTIVALGVAVAVLILAGLYFGTALFRGGAPSATIAAAPVTVAAAPTPAPRPTGVAADGQVVVTATDEVWVRLYDADGKTLHQGTMKPGDTFDVPAGARGPMINVGRPDKIRLTVNGSAIDGLDLGRTPIKDVHIDAAALAARPSNSSPAAPDDARPADEPRAAPAREPSTQRTVHRRRGARLSETQRANLESARAVRTTGSTR